MLAVGLQWVPNRPGHYHALNEDLIAACDENTIGEGEHAPYSGSATCFINSAGRLSESYGIVTVKPWWYITCWTAVYGT